MSVCSLATLALGTSWLAILHSIGHGGWASSQLEFIVPPATAFCGSRIPTELQPDLVFLILLPIFRHLKSFFFLRFVI